MRSGESFSDDLACLAQRFDGLQRQSVDQVEIQIADISGAEPHHRRLDVPHRLQAADRRLNQRIDVLHAETRSGNAQLLQAHRQRWRHVSRIEFDRVLVVLLKDEMPAQDIDNGREPFGTEDARGSPAPVQPRNTQRSGRRIADERDLALKGLAVPPDHIVPQRLLGVAAAIKTELAAIRHMQIERNRLASIQPTQPPRLVDRPHGRRELGGRRIGRIAGDLQPGVTAHDIVHRGSLSCAVLAEMQDQKGRRRGVNSGCIFGRVWKSPQSRTAAKMANTETTAAVKSIASSGMTDSLRL